MAVETYGDQFRDSGFDQAMEAHVTSHEQNTAALMNIAEGKKKSAPRPIYDPSHPDNQWPIMVHHPTKEVVIGKSLKGVADSKERSAIERDNKRLLAEELAKPGARKEPYPKAQLTVADPLSEKKQQLDREEQLRIKQAILEDQVAKLTAALERQSVPMAPPVQS